MRAHLKHSPWIASLLIWQLSFGFSAFAQDRDKVEKADKKEKDEAAEELDVQTVQGSGRDLTLSLGVSKTLEFPFEIGPIHIGDESLFKFTRVKSASGKNNKLVLIPVAPGFTDMTLHDMDGNPKLTYSVLVTREEIGRIVSQLESLLGNIEGLQINVVGETVVLDGDILLPENMVRIIRVVDALKDRDPKKKTIPIKNVARISKITMNILAERIEREIGSPEITARVLNNNLLLEGTAQNDFEADRAVEIAKSYLPEVFVEKAKGDEGEVRPKAQGGSIGGVPAIIDLLRIAPPGASPPASDIKITMNYVELSNEYERIFNFEWKPLAQDTSSVKFDSGIGEVTGTLIATISSLFPKLITARNHGHARILKQEQIIVRDGAPTPAAIESAVDLYVRNTNEKGEVALQRVPVQNVTKVKATTLRGSDSIELGIQVTLNTLIGTNQGAPIVAKNSLQTLVTIKNGDSAALGGYAIDEALAGYNREPVRKAAGLEENAGNSTALFNLQRSKQYRRDKRQFIIFVTPEIIRTASAGNEDITRRFRLNAGER